jgi:Spy/CpxP family protein refolding chaperone
MFDLPCFKEGVNMNLRNFHTPLTEAEVDEIYQLLTPKQRQYMDTFTKRSKKSKWLEVLALKKGIIVTEDMDTEQLAEEVDDWVLVEILDGGRGNRPFRCECGMSLRYQYIVTHKKQNKTYKLGETCLENYTHLTPEIIRDIRKGFHRIHLERDELLLKIYRGEKTDIKEFAGIEIPPSYLEQIEHDIPLLDKQLQKLRDRLHAKRMEELQKQRQAEREQLKEILYQSRQRRASKSYTAPYYYSYHSSTKTHSHLCISYEELIERHLRELKQIRAKEELIPAGLRKDWDTIQDIVRAAKRREEFDYGRFKLLLNNLKIPLRIQ